MMKSIIFMSAIALTGATQSTTIAPTTVDQAKLSFAETKVVAQIIYMEINHGPKGFEFSLIEDSAVFVDLEFPGDTHIRIGF